MEIIRNLNDIIGKTIQNVTNLDNVTCLFFTDNTVLIHFISSGYEPGDYDLDLTWDSDDFLIDEQFKLGFITKTEYENLVKEAKHNLEVQMEKEQYQEYLKLKAKFE